MSDEQQGDPRSSTGFRFEEASRPARGLGHGHTHGALGDHDPGHGHAHAHGISGGHSHGSPAAGFVAERSAARAVPELPRGAGRGKLLFFDCPSGTAGDMTIAALLDLGAPRAVLEDAVARLGLEGVELVIETGAVGALGATRFDVKVHSPQEERSHGAIVRLIEGSSLPAAVKELALRIFLRLAEAEAEVHRVPVDEVHFHEVGAVDAIVDIVGAAALFEHLGARVQASPLPLGRGFVTCRHGVIPLPAPATLLCLRGVPTRAAGIEAELVTPTGAAVIATVAEKFLEWPPLVVERVGLGAGTRILPDRPNVLRVVWGEQIAGSAPVSSATHVVLEANLDDMSGELAGYALARLLELGALDVWSTPVTMKKGRPGFVLGALAPLADAERLAAAILQETTTIGVRQTQVSRVELPRRVEEFESSLGMVRVKLSGEPPTSIKVEFDDCARIGRESGLSTREALARVQAEAELFFVRPAR